MIVGSKRTRWFITLAKSSKIGGNYPISTRQPAHHRFPCQPEFRPAMQEQERLALPSLRDVQFRSIRLYGCMFKRFHPSPPGSRAPYHLPNINTSFTIKVWMSNRRPVATWFFSAGGSGRNSFFGALICCDKAASARKCRAKGIILLMKRSSESLLRLLTVDALRFLVAIA